MNNKKLGNEFEKEVLARLEEAGCWAYRFPTTIQGQPFDILAMKDRTTYAFDCKVCSNGRFSLDRIEYNQQASMLKLTEKVFSVVAGFLLKMPDGSIYFLNIFQLIDLVIKGKNRLTKRK